MGLLAGILKLEDCDVVQICESSCVQFGPSRTGSDATEGLTAATMQSDTIRVCDNAVSDDNAVAHHQSRIAEMSTMLEW